ncbi:hypothetical protein QEH32_gp44 [Corynebacterium phage EmiRose]|uniref:Uncharacterized protein n=1 Tax=Corynebacterium phage EmiRose TaxID=2565372 RepID=A0A649VP11_9CAUD|nr:hypothetical protein QEH32_gp44 [Corynebacterium phage EmiRose]QGJ94176.1 hypothetical protein SEA_EMIROSE_44 [Corynebacterium phage EmiRose]
MTVENSAKGHVVGAERLRRYWSTGGVGGVKIAWGTPGDWTRCVAHLTPYLGERAKGYCNLLHKRNTGMYPSQHNK